VELSLWNLKVRPPPKVKLPSVTISIDDSDFQIPFSAPPFYADPNYPIDLYRISKPRGDITKVTITAIYLLFPILQKSHDLIFIY
jgi:hypothetical protein